MIFHVSESRFLGQVNRRRPGNGTYAPEEHRVVDGPTFSSCNLDEKIQHARDQCLCFSCRHVTKDCTSKVSCGINGCPRFHHRLFHADRPPPRVPGIGSATSALDKESIMPVVRVKFRSANGRIREGTVLIDSCAGTTIIRKNFAKALGLQGER